MQNPPGKLLAAIKKALAWRGGKSAGTAAILDLGVAGAADEPLPIPFLKKAGDERQRRAVVLAMIAAFTLAVVLMTLGTLIDQRKAQFVDRMQAIDTALQEAGTAVKLAPLGMQRDYGVGRNAQAVLAGRIADIRASTTVALGVDLDPTLERLDEVSRLLTSVMDQEASLTGFSRRTSQVHGLLLEAGQALEQVMLADQAAGGSANSAVYAHMRESALRAGNLVLQFVAIEGHAETSQRILINDLNDLSRLAGYFQGAPGIYVETPPREISLALARVADMSPELIEYRKNLEKAMAGFTFARRAARDIDATLAPRIEEVRRQTDALRGSARAQLLYAAAVAMTAFGVACIILLQSIHGRTARRQAALARREQDETDNAIIRIMEELEPISEGNLAARATVTEHVTGAIADRVNMAAAALEKAIADSKRSTAQAARLMIAIRSRSEGAVEDFDNAAFQASDSRNVAELGASLVSDAVARMDEAREHMQDVSKRVKRLGEMSQAITSIVDLIEEVTQKTSILALNTSLKAAEAGEEGQAFQVIAKEIRDLSEDARKALRQIGQKVQGIQGETQSVIQTVEAVTQDVVEGSRLWEDARITLNNITDASQRIEETVKRLSAIAREQAEKAASATEVMDELAAAMGQFHTQAG